MVKWSLPAQLQLKHIHDFIALESVYYAKNVVENIVLKSESLKEFPRLGRVVPEMNQESIRELLIYSYRLIYQLKGADVEILAVVHGRQDFQGV